MHETECCIVVHAHNPSTGAVKREGVENQSQLQLHSEVERNLAGPILKREGGGEKVVRPEAGQKNV